jgi:hypothetical protein
LPQTKRLVEQEQIAVARDPVKQLKARTPAGCQKRLMVFANEGFGVETTPAQCKTANVHY